MPNVALSAPGLHRRPPTISSNRLSKVGVCVHPAMGVAATTRAMSYLGLSRVRYDTPKALSAYETALCDAGLNVCGIIASFGDGTPRDMMAQLAVLRALEMRRPGSVSAIEGPNEVNNFPVHWAGTVDPKDGDMTHRMAAKGMVAALHTAVQADDVLRHIPTVGHTDTVPSSAMGAAYANMHVYAHDDGPLDWWLSVDGLAKLKAVNPGMPWFVTEWGDRLTNGKPQVQQAENVLQGVLTHISMGTGAHYIYALFDSDGGAYGLFNADGTPRPAAQALKWLVAFLADPIPLGGGPPAPTVTWSAKGHTPPGQLMVPRNDGSFLQFFWEWNQPTQIKHYSWSLDRAFQVHAYTPIKGEWGDWRKAAGEEQTWDIGPGKWQGWPVPLRLVPA